MNMRDTEDMFKNFRIPGGFHDGEKILVFTRRHWFVLFLNGIFFIVLFLLPIGIYRMIPEIVSDFISGTHWERIVMLFLSGYYLFMWLFFFTSLVDYYLDVWIVTNERIIDVQQISLFRHVVSEQRIVRVQDVTSSVRGIIPTFLDFGDVNIQTAGEIERFTFRQVPHPENVKKIIFKAYEEAISGSGKEADALAADSALTGEGPFFEKNIH